MVAVAHAVADALAEAKAIKDIDHILREICSDSGPNDTNDSRDLRGSVAYNAIALNATEAAVGRYALGLKISNWNGQHRH
ncbi:hypothetical protein E2562_023023 [Oryza meyeriana var. granulata]|uniref:Uncharacterized protein n=1 Tax=Oryza meyeriana var. granulata TaxID=110450 RepID=A0A6G1EYE2_9ORYZ|nr:hypothetical protein E2562_023023 [Oryza meyeriana var. granulata]